MSSTDERIRDLVAHAYAHAPAIRQILDTAGLTPADIQSTGDLARIPVLNKDRLVEIHQANPPFGGFLAVDEASLPRIYISPGPIYDPQPHNPELIEAQLEAYRYIGFGPGDRVLNTFMYHLTPAGLLFDEALRALGATVLPTGPGNTELQIMMMMALKANGFVGQPSYLEVVLNKCDEMGIPRADIPLRKAMFSAEMYTASQRDRFENQYGIFTTSAYGTADLGFVGYTMHDMEGFCITDAVYVQICDPATGEPLPAGEVGEVVVTTFNKMYPLVRFGTGDLGALAAMPHAKTNGKQQLLGLYGRSGEAIKVRGMFLHPSQLKAALTYLPQIRNIQAVITRPETKDVVTVRIEVEQDTPVDEVIGRLKALAESAVRLRIDHVEVVEPGTIKASERTVKDERTWN